MGTLVLLHPRQGCVALAPLLPNTPKLRRVVTAKKKPHRLAHAPHPDPVAQ